MEGNRTQVHRERERESLNRRSVMETSDKCGSEHVSKELENQRKLKRANEKRNR